MTAPLVVANCSGFYGDRLYALALARASAYTGTVERT